MSKHYELEFKNRIARLHLEDGRTLKSLADEYSVSRASITNWINQFRKECQKMKSQSRLRFYEGEP